ncbi:MAG: 30S ribosomal protein S4e [Thermoplasmata archaeon]|nr:30S ribosomal protein S4e [Thermoplasmata archaeon]MCI4359078.1 30S ribosomal protein S4e [Thermoplasmata archaeon]
MTLRLKRRAAPRTWTVPRKGSKWIQRPAPGPHAQDESIPLLLVIRDIRRIAQSAREARLLARSGSILVDGKVVKDLDRGVGLLDALTFATPKPEHFRILKDRRGKLVLLPIDGKEAAFKIGRVRFKHTVPGGRVQVTLHDGRNLLVAADAPYKVGDSLKIELPSQKVLGHLKLAPGHLAYVSGGSHVGQLARVDHVEVRNSSQPNRVHFQEGFSTIKEYVFIVGDTAPQVTLPEGVGR